MDPDAEPGARLMCHLLLRLFRASDDSTAAFESTTGGHIVKSSCNQHLLAAAHRSISVEALLGVLKAILLLGKAKEIKGRVNPATISKPEFCIFFTILIMNMYPIITNINNLP